MFTVVRSELVYDTCPAAIINKVLEVTFCLLHKCKEHLPLVFLNDFHALLFNELHPDVKEETFIL
jgi:hypothetical protein